MVVYLGTQKMMVKCNFGDQQYRGRNCKVLLNHVPGGIEITASDGNKHTTRYDSKTPENTSKPI